MVKPRILAYLIAVATALFVASSFVTPFAGFEPDAFPVPQDDPPAQPAGYAFAIWGVIYVWLLVSAAFGVAARPVDPDWQAVRPALLVSLTVGIFWLAVASQSPIAATVMIWTMLLGALVALFRAPERDRWLLRAPLGLYAGWLAAASWVSVALIGAGYGVLFDAGTWAVIVILAATATAVVVIRSLGPLPEFGAAVAWALAAIAVKSAGSDTLVAALAGLAAVLVAAFAGLRAGVKRS